MSQRMMQALRQPMALTLAILLLPSVAVGSPVAEDPTGLGPYAVTSQEYRLEAEIDELVLTDRPISYWAGRWCGARQTRPPTAGSR
jgi:hypothetical protein